jgi:hypothetical protein
MDMQASPPPFGALSLRRWCVACGAGELFGLGASFGVLALARALAADGFDGATPAWLRAMLGLCVGVIEGGTLGLMQGLALKRGGGRVPVVRLAALTALPAAIVWALVLGFMNPGGGAEPGPVAEPPMALIGLAGVLGGLSGGVLIGACQALALAPRVGWALGRVWIAASATGWAAGLGVIMIVTTLQTAETPMALVALGAVAGAGLGGLALGLGSWWGVRRVAAALG